MERLFRNYACDFLKLRCRCLSFTRLGFYERMHSRFVSRTAFNATACTVKSSRSGERKQLHTPLSSLFCYRNKVVGNTRSLLNNRHSMQKKTNTNTVINVCILVLVQHCYTGVCCIGVSQSPGSLVFYSKYSNYYHIVTA